MEKSNCRRSKGAGSIFKKNSRFYLRINIAGNVKSSVLRLPDGSPCTTQKQASKAAEDLKTVLLAKSKEEIALHVAEAKKLATQSTLVLDLIWGTFYANPNRPDSGESTMCEYERILNQFIEWLKENHPKVRNVANIAPAIATEYLGQIWSNGISGRTYNSYLQALKMIFKYILEPASLDVNPFELLAKKTKETVSRKEFSPEQVNAIFAGFENGFYYNTEVERLTKGRKRIRTTKTLEYKPLHKDEMFVLLNLCCWTGCRGQDGCVMKWENIDFVNSRISYCPQKTARKTNHRIITLPIHPQLQKALEKALSWRVNEFILPAVAIRYQTNPSGIQKDVMKIIRYTTGLDTKNNDVSCRRMIKANAYSLHSFRHSFVSFCANAGVPLAIVAEIVGHGSPAMTTHYSHISDTAKKQAINALPTLSAGSNVQNDYLDQVKKKLDYASQETLLKILALLDKEV